MTTANTEISAARFRETLGHLVTGVTIVTAHGAHGPVGMAANSVTSVSLDPPLVLVCAAHSSTTWPLIREAGRFCINVMARHHDQLCRRFAAKGGDRFAGTEWEPRPAGPAFSDALAWIECEIHQEHIAGDHTIVVGAVADLSVGDMTDPLIFFKGRFGLGRSAEVTR